MINDAARRVARIGEGSRVQYSWRPGGRGDILVPVLITDAVPAAGTERWDEKVTVPFSPPAHAAPQLLSGALVGRRIVLSAKGRDGRAWTAKVLEVLERTPDRVVVRDTKPPWVKSGAGE